MTAVAAGEIDTYRNLEPKSMLDETKSLVEAPWHEKITDRAPDSAGCSSEVVQDGA
jgi:hypothetical protein